MREISLGPLRITAPAVIDAQLVSNDFHTETTAADSTRDILAFAFFHTRTKMSHNVLSIHEKTAVLAWRNPCGLPCKVPWFAFIYYHRRQSLRDATIVPSVGLRRAPAGQPTGAGGVARGVSGVRAHAGGTGAHRVLLAGEPDRWRNASPIPPFAHANGPDHFIDLEELELYGLSVTNLSHFRSEFAGQLAAARAAHPEKFPPIDPAFNKDHTRELMGFLPWAIVENFDKLKSEFSYLKTFQESGGTPEEIANAQANIIYIMGVMGHYGRRRGATVAQLRRCITMAGVIIPIPEHYTTNRIHAKVDGFFPVAAGGGLRGIARSGQIHPAKPPRLRN